MFQLQGLSEDEALIMGDAFYVQSRQIFLNTGLQNKGVNWIQDILVCQ